ncbi:hypothetical protein C8R44DRAFT_981420 [Mycena epipterygia]|nr:hypothetical protein C8R44DRAFT_981420 [Mycena epipterygia]
MATRSFPLIRLGALSTVVVFALITLGLAAALTSATETFFLASYSFAALAIATSVLTLATIPAMIALEILRPGGITSMIIVEIAWLGFLCILWLSTGGVTASVGAVSFFFGGCDAASDIGDAVDIAGRELQDLTDDSALTLCHESSAIEAFAFLNWIILMGYVTTLLIMSVVASSRKHTGVWKSSVANAPFAAPAAGPSASGAYNMQPAAHSTPGSAYTGAVHV